MATKFFVIDRDNLEICDTIEAAREKAEWWMELGRDILNNADDDEIANWMRNGDYLDGIDNGDVEIYAGDDEDDDLRDYDGRMSGREIRRYCERVDVYSGRKALEAVAAERGIEA